ncbi:carbonic anhydrase [Pasteurella sp. PK-2025]|uniref:carbonic anhydrase n=1 Tax=Pasteurella sp. PK-2025 TaxID=3413133 RepID=UPI003C794795
MKMSKLVVFTLSTLALTACQQGVNSQDKHTHWGYTGHEAPEHWASLSPKFAMCGEGKNQTPINIVNAIEGNLPPLKLDYHPSDVNIVNNGHTIQVDFQDDHNTLQLNGRTYALKQFHFHVPSENLIRGKSFPMEAHFVHADKEGNLAVLGVLYTLSGENKRLAPIWQHLPQKTGEKYRLTTAFNPAKLIPKKRDYYRFSGSLTTPPCSEGVSWLVLKHYDTISQPQVNAFSTLMHGHNNRPVQPINARVIVK